MTIPNEILTREIFNDCVVEYYPHINLHHSHGGSLVSEDFSQLKIPSQIISNKNIVEYVLGDKKMIITIDNMSDAEKNKEYILLQQKAHYIDSGLFVVSNIKNIDPNRFPNIDKYYDVVRKHEITYESKCVKLMLITEKINDDDKLNYIKIEFSISDVNKISVQKHFREVVSWLK